MASLPKGFSVNENKDIVIETKEINFFIFNYQRVGHVSKLSIFGFDAYQRIGNAFCVLGICFMIGSS